MNLKKNPELLPLVEWWEKDGKSTVTWLLVAAVAVAGFYGWKGHRAATRAAASEAVASAITTDALEDAVARFGKSPSGGVLKLRLAKSYFDAGRYEESLAQYDGLIGDAPDGFADVPEVGKAQCLEALGRFADALAAFDAFAQSAATNGFLTLTAQLGAVRCLAQQGEKEEALKRIAALKEATKDDAAAAMRVEAAETLVSRFEPAPAAPAVPVPEAPAAPAAPAPAPAA